MTWAPEKTAATSAPGMPAMAQAYARWVNSQGGINGRPLNVLTCNEKNDTVAAAKCAKRAVDANVTFQAVRQGRLVAARQGFVSVLKTLENTSG